MSSPLLMASLYERNDTFYAQFFDEARTPSKKRISLKTKDQSLARAKLARWERAWHLGEPIPGAMTWKRSSGPTAIPLPP